MSLADYNRVRVIGKGSYGEVWLVKHRYDKKQYVLKKIDLSSSSTKERESAEQEAKLLSTLKHPNIVAYKDSFESKDGFLYIAMGFCEGGDLYERLKQQNGVFLEEKQIVEWFVQISMALQYLHDRNILHRDLKTQNIFLTRSKIVKLGDLGIARVLDSSTDMATTLIGTPYYMSPELFSNKPYNHKSDVWALGCCVYEMTTLKHAFNAKDMNSLVYKILKGKMPAMPRNYSADLCTLIRLMLHQNPDLRPSVNQILRNNYIKKNIASFLESTKQRRSSLASAGSEKGSRPIPPPPGDRPRRPRPNNSNNDANSRLPALFNNNNDVRGNQVAPKPRHVDVSLGPAIVNQRGGRRGWGQPEGVEPAVEIAEAAPMVYRVEAVDLNCGPLAKKPGDMNPPHQQQQQQQKQQQPRKVAKDGRLEGKGNLIDEKQENSTAESDAEERRKGGQASAARERRRRLKAVEQKEVAALPTSTPGQQQHSQQQEQPQQHPPGSKDQRPLPKPPPSKQQPEKSAAAVASGGGQSSSSAESNNPKSDVEKPKISGARERRRQKKSQEALEAAARKDAAAARRSRDDDDFVDGRPASARSTASSGSSRSTTSSVGGGGGGGEGGGMSAEERAAAKIVWKSRETKSSASSIDSDDESESKGRGAKKEEISNFIELLDNTLNLNEDEVPEDLESTTKATCGGSLDDIGDATLVAAEVAEDVAVEEETLKVVSVGGSESSSGGGSRSSGGNEDAGGLKASPRYNGAMTITASGRLLDRINRLRRDCIKALGFNALAQAYEVMEDVEESEMEKRLLGLLGQEKFDLYAGKIWQLKFCEDSAFNLK